MNDFEGLLATNYGFKPQGKAAPMAASKGTSNINPTSSPNFDLGSRPSFRSSKTSNSLSGSLADDRDSLNRSMSAHDNREFDGLDDLLGGSGRFSRKSEARAGDSDVNFDSLFNGVGNSSQPPASNLPVYDKPVYDDDIFDGIPGLRNSSKVQYDDVFSSMSSPPKAESAFDDLLGGFGKSDSVPKSKGGKGTQSKDREIPAFDDLIPGFRGGSPPGDRSNSSWSSEPTSVKSTTSSKAMENPFGVSREHNDLHEEASDIGNFKSPKFDGYPSSDANNKAFDDMDPFASLGKSVPAFSSEGNNRAKARSPPRVDGTAAGPQNSNSKDAMEKPSTKTSVQPLKKDVPAKNDRHFDQPVFDIPTVSTNSHKFVPQSTSPPASDDANVMGETSRFEDSVEPDEIWLTVSEIPLFTQPTVAPPPSRPPPPIPQQVPKEGMGPYGLRSSKMNANDFSSFPSSTHHFQIPKSTSPSMRDQVSSVDELEQFAMGRNPSNADEQVNSLSNEEAEMNSAAAAMKEAMDRAEAKFKHAKEVRERESTRTSKIKEAVYWDRDEKATRSDRVEDEEAIDRERFQREREREEKEKEKRKAERDKERARELEREREEKEKELRRLEKERERARELEMERIKVRQAVERATREARERAAIEARLKAERAAVEKVNAEARERAERAAVQRAQSEARERAAAEARERAERAATEARERAEKAAAEAKEREARERASVARAESEARSRAERAAVERAAAEARERAAVDARERAAAAARASQQKNENDLESFFSMGRPSSVPKHRANPMDNFDAQSPNRPETTKPSPTPPTNMRKASSATNIVDDLSSIFGGPPSSGEFQEVDGETEERRRARLERHQRVQTRAAKALAEKNERDLQMQREQAERHRIAETLDAEIKRWAAGNDGPLKTPLPRPAALNEGSRRIASNVRSGSIRSPIDVKRLLAENHDGFVGSHYMGLNGDNVKGRSYSVQSRRSFRRNESSSSDDDMDYNSGVDSIKPFANKLARSPDRNAKSRNLNGISNDRKAVPQRKMKFWRNGSLSSDDDSEEEFGNVDKDLRSWKGLKTGSSASLGKCDVRMKKRVPLKPFDEESDFAEQVELLRYELSKKSAAEEEGEKREEIIFTEKRFDECGISPLTVKALSFSGYVRMTRVQEATLSLCLEGKDTLVKSKTGSGKSVAFLLPAIEAVLKAACSSSNQRVPPIFVLILCPTRELACQIAAEANVLLKYHDGIGVQTLVGGTRFKDDQKRLESFPSQIIVATPGRLLDHVENRSGLSLRLMGLKMLILDEADHLLDLGFRKDIEKIVDCLPRQRQSLLFSATIPREVRRISQLVLKREHVFVNNVGIGCVETPVQVKQSCLIAPHGSHFQIVCHLLKEHISCTPDYKVIVFCTTGMVTSLLHVLFREMKMNVREMHSRKPQLYRTRISDEFKQSRQLILVTSDVSARGMNYPDVTLVLQLGIPSDREQYIHRLGRTGREGKEGQGILLIAPWEEYFLEELKDLPLERRRLPQLDSGLKLKVEESMAKIDTSIKEGAYHAWLGYYNSIRGIGRDKTTLVELGKQFSESIGLQNPPALFRKTALKMGLKDIPGIRVRK